VLRGGHRGPLSSWNSWQWRWQPHLLAARGYAVLLCDPALSTGYGRHMVQRGWGQWGGTPYTDALALTDAALRRPDLDAQRTAVAGGSYGGYLTNWVVGHTDRFRCAVTHASLWSLGQFRGTTDDAVWWDRSWGDPQGNAEFYRRWSPETYADAVRTPTLVIHGGQDYRVPIGEGLRMWTDLTRRGVPARLLVFPDENHWILRPGNVRTWYGAVLGWLDHHLRDAPLDRPPLT
jgi:dipeptidyl aminopeptidase/acylaminoacyl peptidase